MCNDNKISLDDFAWTVNDEGLEYTIVNYYNPKDLEDEELTRLVLNARKTLEDIELYLDSKLGDWRY